MARCACRQIQSLTGALAQREEVSLQAERRLSERLQQASSALQTAQAAEQTARVRKPSCKRDCSTCSAAGAALSSSLMAEWTGMRLCGTVQAPFAPRSPQPVAQVLERSQKLAEHSSLQLRQRQEYQQSHLRS